MDNVQIIQTLASTHPDFSRFQAEYSDLGRTDMPDELLEQILIFLAEDPEQAAAITAMRNSFTTKSFMTGGDVAIILAVAFVLRTRIRLERKTDEYGDGQWTFLLEHQPGDSKLINDLFKKLESWFGGQP